MRVTRSICYIQKKHNIKHMIDIKNKAHLQLNKKPNKPSVLQSHEELPISNAEK